MKKVFFLIPLLLSCSESKLPKSSNLDRLRVLSLISEENAGGGQTYAEYAPGSVVTIKPLVSDLLGSGNLSYEAKACVDPGVAFGAEPSCEGNPTLVDVSAGAQPITMGSLTDRTGLANSFNVTIPSSTIMFAGRSVQDQFNGVSYLVTYKLIRASGEAQIAFKRLVVSNRGTRNKNPILSDVLSQGASLSALPVGVTVNLSIAVGAIGAESYQVLKSDGTYDNRTENLVTSWFISDGEVKFLRTTSFDSTEYKGPEAAPTSRKAFIIALTRDERGGASVLIKSFP